jgi:hypothetical protein
MAKGELSKEERTEYEKLQKWHTKWLRSPYKEIIEAYQHEIKTLTDQLKESAISINQADDKNITDSHNKAFDIIAKAVEGIKNYTALLTEEEKAELGAVKEAGLTSVERFVGGKL